MSDLENGPQRLETMDTSRIEIEPEYAEFIPEEFSSNPLAYFETRGVNIKQGDVEYDESGRITEDPTAVKDLPLWVNAAGRRIHPVGKRVNVAKSKVAESGDPFYEYRIMEHVRGKGLPCAKPIAKVTDGNVHLIVMENVPGLRWSYRRRLVKQGWSDAEVDESHKQGEVMTAELQRRFEEEGIIRGWKLSDMIFDIDVANRKLNGLVPVDWERTEIKV